MDVAQSVSVCGHVSLASQMEMVVTEVCDTPWMLLEIISNAHVKSELNQSSSCRLVPNLKCLCTYYIRLSFFTSAEEF